MTYSKGQGAAIAMGVSVLMSPFASCLIKMTGHIPMVMLAVIVGNTRLVLYSIIQ